MTQTLTGLIVHTQSGFFTVQTPNGRMVCQLRGRLKQGKRSVDLAAIGDNVTLTVLDDASGVIEEIHPRVRALGRLNQGRYQQIIIANPDQAVFVFACAHPEPKVRMLDRFLIIAEKQKVPVLIVANKVDLVDRREAEKMFGHYPSLGYPLLYTSTKQNIGIEELRERLINKLSGLSGPSGVGKSSLLNALQPGLGQAVNIVSESLNKGKHTTVSRELFALDGGGYVADTPGMKSLALWDTQPEELDAYFPELRDLVSQCQFSNCNHSHEPGCAVKAAVESGKVNPARYDSYLRLRKGEE